MNSSRFRLLLIVCCTLLMSVAITLPTAAQQTVCTDAAGGTIPCTATPDPMADRDGDTVPDGRDSCPDVAGDVANAGCPAATAVPGDRDNDGFADNADRCPDEAGTAGRDCGDQDGDFITNDGDVCPNESGPAENGGCPAATTDPLLVSTTIPATVVPSTGAANPLIPPADGACQIATATTSPVNVRAEPSLNATIAAQLSPNQFHAVLNTTANAEGIWYRVEAGWVSSTVVLIGGNCPARIIAAGPSGFSISQVEYEEATAGIFLDEECTELFNGMRLCQTILSATADDGSTEGAVPWNVTTCGFGPGGVVCTLNRLTSFVEDDCLPEFCGEQPQIPPSQPGEDDDGHTEGAEAPCEAVLSDLAAQAGDTAEPFAVYDPAGSVGYGLRLPPTEPQPCLLHVYVVRQDAPSNGLLPIDVITLETEIPPATSAQDYYLKIETIAGESRATGSENNPGAELFNVARLDLRGNVCIPTTHGNFASCPGQPVPADLRELSIVPTPDPATGLLISLPPVDDSAYNCDKVNANIVCSCWDGDDCADMFSNACFGESLNCEGEACACQFPDTDD